MHQVQPNAVRFILANCVDPEREDEFNAWYNSYGESLARIGLFKNIVRYESPGSNPRYSSVYDIDFAYPGLAWPMTRSHPAKLGPAHPLLEVTLRGTYQRIGPCFPLVTNRVAKAITFVLSDCSDPAEIDAVDAYFDKFLGSTGAFNASRYALVEGLPDPPHYLEIYEAEGPLDEASLRLNDRPKALVTRFVGSFEFLYSFPPPAVE